YSSPSAAVIEHNRVDLTWRPVRAPLIAEEIPMHLPRLNPAWIRLPALCLALLVGIAHLGERSTAWAVQESAQASDGRQLFYTYCASCHGTSGVGNGPAAMAMRRTPPDITGIAVTNGGVFPEERMRRI